MTTRLQKIAGGYIFINAVLSGGVGMCTFVELLDNGLPRYTAFTHRHRSLPLTNPVAYTIAGTGVIAGKMAITAVGGIPLYAYKWGKHLAEASTYPPKDL